MSKFFYNHARDSILHFHLLQLLLIEHFSHSMENERKEPRPFHFRCERCVYASDILSSALAIFISLNESFSKQIFSQ